MQDMFHVAE